MIFKLYEPRYIETLVDIIVVIVQFHMGWGLRGRAFFKKKSLEAARYDVNMLDSNAAETPNIFSEIIIE